MMATTHLLTVWNPSYADDPLDEHLRILLDGRPASTGSWSSRIVVFMGWSLL